MSWVPGWDLDLDRALAPHRRGAGDPTMRVVDGALWRTTSTADGPATVTLPAEEHAAAWDVVIDTSGNPDADPTLEAGATFDLDTHSLVVLREHSEPEASPDHSVAASLAARSGTDVP